MADIQTIRAQIITSNISNAGTDGDVYLGICGREFHLDTSADDFERDSNRHYVMGSGANIRNSDLNDPRNPQLDTDRLDMFPVYIRFEPRGSSPDWNLRFVSVEAAGLNYGVHFLRGLWLGRTSGKIAYLSEGPFSE